jgi:ATPase subunit of ABC transporter with duplicated ATPase domains
MPYSRQPYVQAEALSYKLDELGGVDRTLFQNIHVSVSTGDRIALVGANGVGKSTLLKILAGQLSSPTGSVQRHGSVYYLPQISTLREQIKAETILEFLSSVSDEWWQISDTLETTFHTQLDWTLPISTLSGGELTKLFLAIGLSQAPNVLLLDEPTNHIDYLALEELRQLLCQFNGAFIIVSHKPFFLDQVVDTTWELTAAGLSIYGGNFSQYREQKQRMLEAQLRSHEVARKELKRTKATVLQEQERAAQSRRTGRQKFLKGSTDSLITNGLKRKAEVAAGKLKLKHEAAVAEATQKVADTKVRTHKATRIQLEERSPKRHNLIEIQGADLCLIHHGNAAIDRCLLQTIQLQVAAGDRISVAGANGSGKSSLAKAIVRTPSAPVQLIGGDIRLAPAMQVVYLDQTYELVQRDRTILENMQWVNTNLDYQLIRQQLGHFLFFGDDVRKPAAMLSGGELTRLAIAMITIAEIDLLILDEPTNNLDVVTVDRLIAALNDYQGALWVITHDLDFLSRIQITRSFKIADRSLQLTTYLPSEGKDYYQELIGF